MDRNFLQLEQACRLEAGGPNHDDAVLVQHQRLAKAEFTNGRGNGFDRVVVVAGIVGIEFDVHDFAHLDVHGGHLKKDRGG